MAEGLQVDGIVFSATALEARPDHAAALGRIFTSWSLIEASVSSLLGLMMHADPRAAIALLWRFPNNRSRVEAIRIVGKELLHPAAQGSFDKLMKDVLDYAKERNDIAHHLWGVHPDEPDFVFRMQPIALSSFAIGAPHMDGVNVEDIVSEFKSKMTRVSLNDLSSLEQRGASLLDRVMSSMNERGYDLSVQKREENAEKGN